VERKTSKKQKHLKENKKDIYEVKSERKVNKYDFKNPYFFSNII